MSPIINSESTDGFMAKVKSVFSKWEACEKNLGKEPKFEAYRKLHEKRNARDGLRDESF